ncbi:putative 3'5'-cyclic nucleotide phosphodiesterase [Leishmania naiffi]|uniref:Phosphodiesterase n=1 Tax=Leishmania naiffi TaxID=5678 RepID=A0AAW3BHQ9_9TRYP
MGNGHTKQSTAGLASVPLPRSDQAKAYPGYTKTANLSPNADHAEALAATARLTAEAAPRPLPMVVPSAPSSRTGWMNMDTPATTTRLLGKGKYIKEYGALVMSHRAKTVLLGTLFLFCEAETESMVVSYHEKSTGSVYTCSYTDEELGQAKEAAGVGFSWAPFFKSIATAMIKSTATVTSLTPTRKDAGFTIFDRKEPSCTYSFVVPMEMVSKGCSPNAQEVFRYVMYPLTRALRYNRTFGSSSRKEMCAQKLECDLTVHAAAATQHTTYVDKLLPTVRPLREESALHSHLAMAVGREVRNLERCLKAREEHIITKHPLDQLYDEGGAQSFQHTLWCPEYIPQEEDPDELLSLCIRCAFPLDPSMKLSDISSVLERPEIRKKMDASGNGRVITEAFEIFKGIDHWDYDTIQLEIITDGNALFYTTYLLLYKLDLVRYFNLDDAVLRRFLIAVQSAYHPNPYHNAMHGADVTQINYYIMIVAGLSDKCCLSKEEIFAGIIAGAVHDFDHPGLNNNFHSRTGAYLATLYNDRSILENHHLACTFELLRNPRYNILATLSDEQRLLVRETILEMVLATDMGNHARIFKNFQVRMSEATEWHSKKEDVRLALSMSIKMADISNCARPNHIYAEWAKNISKEFYLQGDAERKLNLSISPFMDRTKEMEEFPKGQVSFMMYIVQPMVEAISALLPSMTFAINLCVDNKEYWRRKTEEAQQAESVEMPVNSETEGAPSLEV